MSDMQMESSFTVDRNKRHQVQIEPITASSDGTVTNNVFFKREYEQAINIVNSIIDIQKNASSKNDLNVGGKRLLCQKRNDRLGNNNIVLFTGNRGSGKTSAALSFAQYLENINKEDLKFCSLPMIDPSYFNNNDSVLKTVLTTMFKMAKSMLDTSMSPDERNGFNELWRKFEKVFATLGDIEGKQIDDYSLVTLNELGDASNLQEYIQSLIDEFAQKIGANYLVLFIDDIDMNVSYAARMLEQIRKFLMLDKLIILMAANMNQLQNEMREFYSSSYKHTLNASNQSLVVDVDDMATKYLLKVFPASRRIHVSNATSNLINARLKIINAKCDVSKYDGNALQPVVLTMIWERTRVLFLPKDDGMMHPIIPKNLRDLSQFVNFLLDMNKVECDVQQGKLFKDAGEYYLCLQNFTKFKNHILNNWIPENLSYEEVALFKSIPQDVSEVNKHLINAINVIGTKNKKRLMSREVDLEQIAKNAEGVNIDRDIYTMVSPNDPKFVKANKISDIFNQPSNYSYGDLLLMIDKYETYFESEDDRRFINAIKIYYSIILFETFFFSSTNVRYSLENIDNISVDTIIPIQRLLGGTVYYPNYFEIITSAYFRQKGPSFDAKRAFYHKFTYQFKVKNSQKNQESEMPKIISSIREEQAFILFFILYYGDVRPDRYDQKHTYDTTHYHDASINGVQYATFDILSLFNNVLNPIQTVLRANDVLKIKDYPNNSDPVSYKIRESLSNKISEWGKICKIDENHSLPNSILPFYSVDAMLQYLRTSYEDVDIIRRTPESKQAMTGVNVNDVLLSVLDFDKYYQLITEKSFSLKSKMQDIGFEISPEVNDAVENNETMLMYLRYHLFDEDTKTYTIDQSKDMIISVVLGNDKIEDKTKKDIIKQVHGFSSIAEIYNYIKGVLWKDMIMEMIVRRKVQEQIRNKASIHNYYNNLWALTQKAFNRISVENKSSSNIELVYKNIFDRGVRLFID